MTPALIAVMGPTASGKTPLAEALAEQFGAQLVNADAFQAYRGLDIGTAKPSNPARYRLMDIKDPNETYGVGEFCQLAQKELENLWEQQRSAVVVGGSGLYIRALFEQYDDLKHEPDDRLRAELQNRLQTEGLPALIEELKRLDPHVEAQVDLRNPVRVTRALERALDHRPSIKVSVPPFRQIKLGLLTDISHLGKRIEDRTRLMVQNGWVQEVRLLLDGGYGPGDPGFRAIGYAELAKHIEGKTDLEEAITTAIVETRRYAKRQRTWLRSEPRLLKLDPADTGMVDEAVGHIRTAMQ